VSQALATCVPRGQKGSWHRKHLWGSTADGGRGCAPGNLLVNLVTSSRQRCPRLPTCPPSISVSAGQAPFAITTEGHDMLLVFTERGGSDCSCRDNTSHAVTIGSTGVKSKAQCCTGLASLMVKRTLCSPEAAAQKMQQEGRKGGGETAPSVICDEDGVMCDKGHYRVCLMM